MTSPLPPILERRRFSSPTVTPQALAWHKGNLWMSSRDLRHFYGINTDDWRVIEEREAPGIPWAADSVGDEMRVTIGEGENDERDMWRYARGIAFYEQGRLGYHDYTGWIVSFGWANVYVGQWCDGLN